MKFFKMKFFIKTFENEKSKFGGLIKVTKLGYEKYDGNIF